LTSKIRRREAAAVAHAGVVDQHVKRAEVRDRRGDGFGAGLGIRHVAGHREALPALALDVGAQAVEPGGIPVQRDDARAGPGEAQREGTAEPAARAGHEHRPACEGATRHRQRGPSPCDLRNSSNTSAEVSLGT
jgi:hypothetical protein